MPQHAPGEGCSGAKGTDEEDSEQDESNSGRSAENYLGASSPDEVESERDESDSGRSDEDCGGANCSDEENSEQEDSKVRVESTKKWTKCIILATFCVEYFGQIDFAVC